MANNVQKLDSAAIYAAAFGASERPIEMVKVDETEHVHEEMQFYGIETGEIIRFLPSYTEIGKQKVSARGTGFQYVIPVERELNGEKFPSLFNLNTLNKRDAKNNYIHKEIVAAGGLKARVALLCEWGAIIGGNPVVVDVPAFDNTTGKREKITVEDPETGQIYLKNAVKSSEVVTIKKYEAKA